LIWDGDKDAVDPRPEDNHRLLRLMGHTVEDWPSKIIRLLLLSRNLEKTFCSEIGSDNFNGFLAECQSFLLHCQKETCPKKPYGDIRHISESTKRRKEESNTGSNH